jgi:hypothetical protein
MRHRASVFASAVRKSSYDVKTIGENGLVTTAYPGNSSGSRSAASHPLCMHRVPKVEITKQALPLSLKIAALLPQKFLVRVTVA